MAVPWVCDVKPTRHPCWNQLDSNGSSDHIALVSNDVDVVTRGVGKRHVSVIDVRLAVGIVAFILRDRARCDDDQAMPRVCMPASASPGCHTLLWT